MTPSPPVGSASAFRRSPMWLPIFPRWPWWDSAAWPTPMACRCFWWPPATSGSAPGWSIVFWHGPRASASGRWAPARPPSSSPGGMKARCSARRWLCCSPSFSASMPRRSSRGQPCSWRRSSRCRCGYSSGRWPSWWGSRSLWAACGACSIRKPCRALSCSWGSACSWARSSRLWAAPRRALKSSRPFRPRMPSTMASLPFPPENRAGSSFHSSS